MNRDRWNRLLLLVLLAACADVDAQAGASADQEGTPPGAEAAPGEAPAKHHSPWLFVPLVSSNPKLGSSVGLMVGYVRKLDPVSEPSMLALQMQRSNTSSTTFGLGGKAFWGENVNQLQFGVAGGHVSNDYLDFLGSGQQVRSAELGFEP